MSERVTRLGLVGGGHSHAIFLRYWGKKPLKGVELTLISDVVQAPYSGMLPGYLAGFYGLDDTHIDLISLAHFAQAHFVLDKAIALDAPSHTVIGERSGPLTFDYLSIDIGSTPQLPAIPGAEYIIPAKPVPGLLTAWENFCQSLDHIAPPVHLTLMGGGLGGIELALNCQARLQRDFQARNQNPGLVQVVLIHRHERLLNGYPPPISQYFDQILQKRGIQCHYQTNIQQIQALAPDTYQVTTTTLPPFTTHLIIGTTQASPAPWIQASGLATDNRGFICVDDTLRSPSHPNIFATGDIASQIHHPRPKAGVFAVRQGKPLWHNLQRLLQGQPLQPYLPQNRYLSLIGTGDRSAIALWSSATSSHSGQDWIAQSPLFWIGKDWIDRRFMAQFQGLG